MTKPAAHPLDLLKELICSTTESNQAKMQFLKEEIEAKRYRMDSSRIADRLLEYALNHVPAELA